MAQVCGLRFFFATEGLLLEGFGIESIIVKTGKINATRQEQFKRVTTKPPKPINTLLYFVSQLSPGTFRHLKTPMQGSWFNLPNFGF
jgi:hypothetical protein